MRYHFSGVAGAGMNPLASLVRARGHDVQGSDRSFDQGKNREIAARLQGLGIQLAPHDGAAVTRAIDRFVYSAAVEADTPEMRAARALGLHCVSRPQLLAEVVNAGGPGIAVSGTSGKSTILGMVAWLLREGGVPATVLGGAALGGEGTGGCFIAGPAEGPVVAEACESDGTLAGYRPAIGLVHNVSRDHAELPALRPQFAAFAENCGRLLVNGACPEAAALGRRFKASTYGVPPGVDTRLWVTSVGRRRAPVRGGGHDRERHPRRGRLRAQWREDPRGRHHGASQRAARRRRLSAPRVRPGPLSAPRAQGAPPETSAASGPLLLRGGLLRGRHGCERRLGPSPGE